MIKVLQTVGKTQVDIQRYNVSYLRLAEISWYSTTERSTRGSTGLALSPQSVIRTNEIKQDSKNKMGRVLKLGE